MIQTLVDAYPEARYVVDRDGNLPMEVAIEKGVKHGARALGTTEVKHALTNLAVSRLPCTIHPDLRGGRKLRLPAAAAGGNRGRPRHRDRDGREGVALAADREDQGGPSSAPRRFLTLEMPGTASMIGDSGC